MNYSTSKLTTIQECESVAALILEEKNELEFKIAQNKRNQDQLAKSVVDLQADKEQNDAERAISDAVLAKVGPGPRRDKELTKKSGLDYKDRVLTSKLASNGSGLLIMKELSAAGAENDKAEIAALMTAIEARKAAL